MYCCVVTLLTAVDPPSCGLAGEKILGVGLGQHVAVECRVEADPENVTFTWFFNNTNEFKVRCGLFLSKVSQTPAE